MRIGKNKTVYMIAALMAAVILGGCENPIDPIEQLMPDREPEKTDAAMAQVEAFSRYFIKVHGVHNA